MIVGWSAALGVKCRKGLFCPQRWPGGLPTWDCQMRSILQQCFERSETAWWTWLWPVWIKFKDNKMQSAAAVISSDGNSLSRRSELSRADNRLNEQNIYGGYLPAAPYFGWQYPLPRPWKEEQRRGPAGSQESQSYPAWNATYSLRPCTRLSFATPLCLRFVGWTCGEPFKSMMPSHVVMQPGGPMHMIYVHVRQFTSFAKYAMMGKWIKATFDAYDSVSGWNTYGLGTRLVLKLNWEVSCGWSSCLVSPHWYLVRATAFSLAHNEKRRCTQGQMMSTSDDSHVPCLFTVPAVQVAHLLLCHWFPASGRAFRFFHGFYQAWIALLCMECCIGPDDILNHP